MAEVFGTVSGALGVAALFNNCVECFEYIQLARHFGEDFQRCQLKLDVARVRLTRWGVAVKINEDPRFRANAPPDRDSQRIQDILEEIDGLFASAQKKSKRYEADKKAPRFDEKELQPPIRKLHDRLKRLARERQKSTTFLKKATWALYDAKQFTKLLEDIIEFVDALEKIFPERITAYSVLVEVEIEEVTDETSLKALQDAASGVDDAMSAAVEKKAGSAEGNNYIQNLNADESAYVLLGSQWANSAVSQGNNIPDRTMNHAGSVAAKGQAKVQVGNRFGGRGFFD